MNRTKLVTLSLIAAVGLAGVVASLAIAADPPKDAKLAAAAAQPEIKLPPGWTMEDMKACVMAGTPGEMQKRLAAGAGTWSGKARMWMAPDTEPTTTECTATVTPIMDGRYTKVEHSGEMPGMGPYLGSGIYGFDNVTQKFVCTWIDNQSTGIMTGTGTLSPDGKTLTWNVSYTCPITQKPAVMREVETITGPKTRTLEMTGADPKTGKEFKMMSIEFTKK